MKTTKPLSSNKKRPETLNTSVMKRPTPTDIDDQDAVVQKTDDGELPVIRWSNRRRMAWRAFYAILIYTPFYWLLLPLWFHYWGLPTTWLEAIADSFFWFASTMAAVIIAYMGFTTMPFVGKNAKTANGTNKYQVYDEDY